MILIACLNLIGLKKKYIAKTGLIMKLTTILMLAVCLHANAEGYSQRVTLSQQNVPLKKVFNEISKQTGYIFIYTERLLQKSKKIYISTNNALIEQVLKECFKDQPLTYSIVENYIIVKEKEVVEIHKEPVFSTPTSPPINITGTITDDKGQPLTGATVNVKGTRTGTATDANGNFAIVVPEKGGVLIMSFIGFETVEVTVAKATTLSISLKQSEVSSQEMAVVTAFGIRRDQKSLGYASQKVKGEQLSAVGNTNIQNSLQGKAAGVQVRLSSGMPGRPALINIRGSRSITGSNEPLYVIDGLPVAAGRRSIDFNPSDVESMDILKGPAAAALYGVRASNE